ncbi:TolC family protein [Chitinophaga rhizophila]|uniref:TolC family protein n=1 Tax=Chitinophaga rhizophila TaxID=2866212 RepID=A0ABS7GHH5_9BACT|nr:TolC family protein [Chitinophaga rhizophila]MBW8687147.1 TolC family protein [Chitinophaga rhizophila]
MRRFIVIIILSGLSFSCLAATPQDTLYYTSDHIEKVFLENNLLLLAEKLNVDQAQARVIQAGAWPNPTFTLDEIQVYKNSTTDQIPPLFGNFWRDRNVAAQLEQLIFTARKRRKNITLAADSKEMAETVLKDLLLTLKTELRQTVADVFYIQQVRDSWYVQLEEIGKLVRAHQSQYSTGYISEAELLRLKALEVSLHSSIIELEEEMSEKQNSLRNLLFIPPTSHLVVTDTLAVNKPAAIVAHHSLADLLKLSEQNSQLKITQSQLKVSESQLAVEKANAVPNISLIASYDRNGSVMRDFVGVGVSMDLPFFDRNKGNIRAAQYAVSQSHLLEKNKRSEVQNAIARAWNDLRLFTNLYEKIDKHYISRIDTITFAISKNFAQHNISLLEFLDYYESFRESKQQYYQAIRNIINKKAELNYLTGEEL